VKNPFFRSVFLFLTLSGAAGAPLSGEAAGVDNFQKERYLGLWYEIARMDFFFERNLNNTTAEYALMENGLVGVTNRGYDVTKNRWKTARGRARFRGPDTVGELEVSFFGPFWSDYTVVALDGDYRHALVAGKDTDYLWILSRDRTLPGDIREKYLNLARSLGYDTEALIWVDQNPPAAAQR